MKQIKHQLSSKWFILFLLIIIGGSTGLVANAFLRHPYETGNRTSDSLSTSAFGSTPGIVPTNTTAPANGNTISIQSHLVTPTVIRSPGVTPTNNPNNPTTPPPSTAPSSNNGTTLPPGSALPGDST